MISVNQDFSGYYLVINENGQTYNSNYIIPNDLTILITITYQNNTVNYYMNSLLLRSVNKVIRNKLYLNLSTYYSGQTITNIGFKTIKEYYSGGNGFYCDGFQGNDTVASLSGFIVYSGTSQGATNSGTYSIIPSGFSSLNYAITYITGTLTLKKSIQS
jgi:hypothetical protein